ncbi:MAG TPA: PIN domain-containing protein [Acholeplasmataceae bacterium]|nr:PIN domain-containing protein [Acholeplasmataceae bacterium]
MDLITDTNIWIDFITVEALKLPFMLRHQLFICKETFIDELLFPVGINKDLLEYGLKPIEMEEIEYIKALELLRQYPKLSTYDTIALSISINRKINLLTGDKRLKQAAKDFGIKTHGTLWVFDELLHDKTISQKDYIKYMEKLKENCGKKIRLPILEIEKRIKKCNFIIK